MKKAIIIRYGAFGDVLHCTHLPRLLKENGYDYVAFETNTKGLQILAENPYIDELIYFDPASPQIANKSMTWLSRHIACITEGYDKVINLSNTIEYKYIAMEDQNEYYMNDAVRREKYGNINYYDIAIDEAGLPKRLYGTTGEVYFKDDEEHIVRRYVSLYEDRFKILVNLSGSSLHKRFIQAEDIMKKIKDKYPEALIITTGDKDCKEYDFKVEDSISMVGKYGIRQMILLSKYMDLCIGCESGLMVASNMWNTPTVQLLTAANMNNHPKYAKNDYSLQSPIKCAPCHKGPYKYIGCPMKNGYPKCIWFDEDTIINRIDKIYNDYKTKKISKRNIPEMSVV